LREGGVGGESLFAQSNEEKKEKRPWVVELECNTVIMPSITYLGITKAMEKWKWD
jgi:hypothetical protein